MKVVLGMSGGVDSAAAASLLQDAGHCVYGVTLVMAQSVQTDIDGAFTTAQRIGIPHTVLDCTDLFRTNVLADFAASYARGETPNPCIRCNPTVKFSALLSYMEQIGADAIATGHYARVQRTAGAETVQLLRGVDAAKDQSYMLYRLTDAQLAHVLFPLGTASKSQIRALAAERGLLPQIPKDSMDICFLPDGNYTKYLETEFAFAPNSGAFCLADGRVVGTHCGQWQYTKGQRKGLGLALGYPVYVTEKDAEHNCVYVGTQQELYASTCILRECRWISMPNHPAHLSAKIRYSRSEAAVSLTQLDATHAKLTFAVPQRAMTRGQSAVVYEGKRVLGGGFIEQVLP